MTLPKRTSSWGHQSATRKNLKTLVVLAIAGSADNPANSARHHPGDQQLGARQLAQRINQLINGLLKSLAAGPAIIQADAIRLLRIDAPSSIEPGQPVKLRCLYELRNEKLQSLAWYKNGKEFYRYQPFERRQSVLTFPLIGVHVDMSKSRNSTVQLTNTTLETAGRYKCEATSTTFREANQEVVIRVTEAQARSGAPPAANFIIVLTLMPYLIALLLVVVTRMRHNLQLSAPS